MAKAARLFQIVQLLMRANRPLTAGKLARILEVSQRTIYRDILALQTSRVPVEGSAGVGYAMGNCADISSLIMASDEMEAIAVGLGLVGRCGDPSLSEAAARAHAKLSVIRQNDQADRHLPYLLVQTEGKVPRSGVDPAILRQAIRDDARLRLVCVTAGGRRSSHHVCPLALVYHSEAIILAVWNEDGCNLCEFRVDTILSCEILEETFATTAGKLRAQWMRDAGGRAAATGMRARFTRITPAKAKSQG